MDGQVPGVIDTHADLIVLIDDAVGTIMLAYPNIRDRSIGAGPFRKFDLVDFGLSLTDHGEYKGVAINMFWFDLKSFSPVGYLPIRQSVVSHGDHYFDIEVQVRTCTTKSWRNAITVPISDVDKLPPPGSLQRLNNDLDVIASVVKLAKLIKDHAAAKDEDKEFLKQCVDSLLDMLCHVPVDFVTMATDIPDADRAKFYKSFQLIEDIKIKSEEEQQSAWETACSFARVRDDNKASTGDMSASAVHKCMAANIRFAKSSSDYACRATDANSKGADNALLIFDKCTKADVAYVLQLAKPLFGGKSALTQMSKLTTVQPPPIDKKVLIDEAQIDGLTSISIS